MKKNAKLQGWKMYLNLKNMICIVLVLIEIKQYDFCPSLPGLKRNRI